MPVEQGVILSL